MNKMMQDKAQDQKLMNDKVELWFQHHFHQVAPGTALYAALVIAKDDVKKIFGINTQRFEKELST